MKKPKIWRFNKKWYCGRYMSPYLKAPIIGVGDYVGSGKSPSEAYTSWIRNKWGVARTIVKLRKERADVASSGRHNPMSAASGPEPSYWRLPKWLKA